MNGHLVPCITLIALATACDVLKYPDDSNVPTNVYTVSDPIDASGCSPFSKAMNVYGLLLVAAKTGDTEDYVGQRDLSFKWLAQAVTEMFPSTASDLTLQAKVLDRMYRYRAANPLFITTVDAANMAPARDYLSLCDTITVAMIDGGNTLQAGEQILEIMEHLWHIITNVGLQRAFPSEWGVTTTSDIYLAMEEAKSNGVYDDTSYDGSGDATLSLKIQEFAYWALSSIYGTHHDYSDSGGYPEWKLCKQSQNTNCLAEANAASVQNYMPKFWALHQATTAKLMAAPSTATLTELGKLRTTTQTAATPTWPITGSCGSGCTITNSDSNAKCFSSMPPGGSSSDGDGGDGAIIGIVMGAVAFILSGICAATMLGWIGPFKPKARIDKAPLEDHGSPGGAAIIDTEMGKAQSV